MSKEIKPKKIFNQSSTEAFNEAKIIGGNPNGIFNFNKTNHLWATKLYKKMEARTWFPGQVNITKDKNNYTKLDDAKKRTYDLILAQLITNDSLQTNQLMDKINSYITSPIVNACISRQASEEATHSYSYAVMAEDICKDTDRIYQMHLHDEELAIKNKAVEDMYGMLYSGDNPTKEDILLAFVANQILEELVFPGGFAGMLSMGNIMPGTAEMIAEIMKDETLSHVQLFKYIFRTAIEETFNNTIPVTVANKAKHMIIDMVEAEKRWTKYATKGLMGFSDRVIDIFVESQANSVCSNLGLKLIYPKHKENPLKKILTNYLKGGDIESRGNFFEANIADYSKGSLIIDF